MKLLAVCLIAAIAVPAVATQIVSSRVAPSWPAADLSGFGRGLPGPASSFVWSSATKPIGSLEPQLANGFGHGSDPTGWPVAARPSELIESPPATGSVPTQTGAANDSDDDLAVNPFASGRSLPGGRPSDSGGTIHTRFSTPEPAMIVLFGLTGLVMFKRRFV